MKTSKKEKTTPFGVNLMRSQVLYQAAQLQTFKFNEQLWPLNALSC